MKGRKWKNEKFLNLISSALSKLKATVAITGYISAVFDYFATQIPSNYTQLVLELNLPTTNSHQIRVELIKTL